MPRQERNEEIKPVEEVVEPVQPERSKEFGKVVNCTKLNVRKKPSASAEVDHVINAGDKVEIVKDMNDTFYKITTAAGKTGFCMKEFIKIV